MAATTQLSLNPSVPPGDPRRLSLYVGDLDPDVTELDLKTVFSSMGPVFSVRICRCYLTGRSLCYGYVNFYSHFHAYNALCFLNHTYLKGKPMRLMWCQRNPSARRSSAGNLYVKNLDASIDSAGLLFMFSKFGTVLSCKVVEEHGTSKGYGFVQFDSEIAALAARTALHDTLVNVNGKKLHVSQFVRKSDRTASASCEEQKFSNLYVKNLPKDMTQDALEKTFSAYGEVRSAVIMKDHKGESRGFGFINFRSPDDARKAVDALNGSQLDSRTLFVGRAQKKAEREKILLNEYKDNFKSKMEKLKASNLYVKNLAVCVDDKQLQELFISNGKIVSAKVMRYNNGVSRGFGFVCFSNPEEAKKALNALNGTMFQGKSLYVAMAQSKRDRQLTLQKYIAPCQSKPPYHSESSVAPSPPINTLYPNFSPCPTPFPFLQHTSSCQRLGANTEFQGLYSARSFHQYFPAYVPMPEMYQNSQKPTNGSCQLPAVKHATPNLSSQDLNRGCTGIQVLSYSKSSKNKYAVAENDFKRLLATAKSTDKFKKFTMNLHPHVENLQPGHSGNTAGMLSETSNSNSSSSLDLQPNRISQVLKEVNILKKEDDGAEAMPKKAARCLNY